jgi:hypothetical protein
VAAMRVSDVLQRCYIDVLVAGCWSRVIEAWLALRLLLQAIDKPNAEVVEIIPLRRSRPGPGYRGMRHIPADYPVACLSVNMSRFRSAETWGSGYHRVSEVFFQEHGEPLSQLSEDRYRKSRYTGV